MRYKLRITRKIALIICVSIVLYLHVFKRFPAGLTGLPFRGQPTVEIVRPASDGIQTFWANWSKNFRDARPSTERVLLFGNANAAAVPTDASGPRQPARDYVVSPDSDIESMRASHAALLEALKSSDLGGDIFSGTGIVVVGGGEYFGPAIVGLHMLRKTGCNLPVEVFVADAEEYEPSICDDYLPKLGARCLVLADFLLLDGKTEEPFNVEHYQLKALAILFSSFAEVLYFDSDSIPLVNPSTELFPTEPYKSSGLVIWPDFWIASESPIFYTIANLSAFPPNLPTSSNEAGQLLINKKTHLRTLLLATYYNIYGPNHFYPLLSQGVIGQGDKETFMAAAVVLGQSYYRVKTPVVALSRNDGHELKGSGMVQHHPSDDHLHSKTQTLTSSSRPSAARTPAATPTTGKSAAIPVRPAFFHANTPKMNAGHLVAEGDLFDASKKRLRLWGSAGEQVERFGYDLEKAVWEILVQTGCELEDAVREWRGKKRICARLEEHWDGVFERG